MNFFPWKSPSPPFRIGDVLGESVACFPSASEAVTPSLPPLPSSSSGKGPGSTHVRRLNSVVSPERLPFRRPFLLKRRKARGISSSTPWRRGGSTSQIILFPSGGASPRKSSPFPTAVAIGAVFRRFFLVSSVTANFSSRSTFSAMRAGFLQHDYLKPQRL